MAADHVIMYENLAWQMDRLLIGDVVFRLEHYRRDDWELGDQCFHFYRTKELIDQYAQFWQTRPGFAPQNIIELGIWDGDSLAFWFETLHPAKLIGVDIQRNAGSPYFQSYLAKRGLHDRLKAYWETDQSDAAALRRIVSAEFSAPLDLIIDDASHHNEPTKASFETLFGCLRPGGLYVIEDWAWGHWQSSGSAANPWFRGQRPLTDFIQTLVGATGSWDVSAGMPSPLIANVAVFQGLAVIERGRLELDRSQPFVLEDFVRPTDQQSFAQKVRGLSAQDLADQFSTRKIARAMAIKLAARPGFGWLTRFKALGKRLLAG